MPLAVLLFAGCVKEEAVCESGVVLSFQYLHNPENRDLFGSEVEKVTVFVFDEAGYYTDSYSESGPRLAQEGYRMSLPLPRGKYTLLVWGGLLDTYIVGEKTGGTVQPELRKGITKLEDFRLTLDTSPSSRAPQPDPNLLVAADPDDLYYGKAAADVNGMRLQEVKVPLIKNTSKLQFKVTELPSVGGPSPADIDDLPYTLSASGANTMLNGNNGIAAEAPMYGYVPSGFDADKNAERDIYGIYMGMPRLITNNAVDIKLWSEQDQEYLIDGNLLTMILSSSDYNSQNDIDREDLFLFEVVVDRRVGLSVTVHINGFEIISIEPDWK